MERRGDFLKIVLFIVGAVCASICCAVMIYAFASDLEEDPEK